MTYPARARRRLPDLLRRADDDGPRGRRRGDPARPLVARSRPAEELVRAANEAGGRDNITVVLFRLGEEGEADEADAQATMVAGDTESLRTEDVQAAVAAAAERDPETAPRRDDGASTRSRRARCASSAARPADRGRAAPRLRRWVTAVVVVLVVGAVVVGFWVGSRQFYFVGTDDRGLVALYRGLPYELPFGVELWDERVLDRRAGTRAARDAGATACSTTGCAARATPST